MTELETQLIKHADRAKDLRDQQRKLETEMEIAQVDFSNFLKQNGFPDGVGLAEMLHFAMRKNSA
jgi:hypothetical protein